MTSQLHGVVKHNWTNELNWLCNSMLLGLEMSYKSDCALTFSSRGRVWWKCIRQGCFYWFWILVYIASCIPKVYRRLSLPRVSQMHLILNLCISEGFDTFPTLLYTWADECCMVSLLKSMITTPSYFTLPREYN